MPKYVAGLSPIDQENGRTAGGRERAPNLKNEGPIAAESECPRQLSRRVEFINAWCEKECPQVLTGQVRIDWLARQKIVGREGISLCLGRDRVIVIYRSIHDPRRIKPGNRSAWRDAQIPSDNGIANARHRRTSQNREAVSRTENIGFALRKKTGQRH